MPDEFDQKMAELGRHLGLGGLGTHSEGLVRPDDEGDLRFALSHRDGKVLVNFGKPVAWLGMGPDDARALAACLVKHADALKPSGKQAGPSAEHKTRQKLGVMQELVERFGGHVTVERAWLTYAGLTLRSVGVAPDSVQWRESKKVFYAAWHGALEFQLHIIGHPGMSEDKGAEILQRQLDECQDFLEELKREAGA